MPLRVMILEFGGSAITEHLHYFCFIHCRVISCHFSHCEGVELLDWIWLHFLFEQGHGNRREISDDHVVRWTWTSFRAYSDDSPCTVVSHYTVCGVGVTDGPGISRILLLVTAAIRSHFPSLLAAFQSGLEKSKSAWAGTDRALFVH
jgi:hypothetical protein